VFALSGLGGRKRRDESEKGAMNLKRLRNTELEHEQFGSNI